MSTAQAHWNAAAFLAPTLRKAGKSQKMIQRTNINDGDNTVKNRGVGSSSYPGYQ